ncbi:MAG: Flp family type IVb pilin [Pseudomonadota bacterium]
MNTFRECAKRLQRDESGATAIEYGLIMSLMAVALIGAIGATGKSTGDKWDGIANKVGDAMDDAGG